MDTSSQNSHRMQSGSNIHAGNTDPDKGSMSSSGNIFIPRSTGSLSTPFAGIGSLGSSFSHSGTRRKTISESSDASSVDMDPSSICQSPTSSMLPSNTHSRLSDSQYNGQNLSFGNSNQVVYDIDGKFPYTYYENKPTLYDIDGTHRYKYYKANKPTPYTEGAPHHEKRPWIYDPADGLVMCLTARDVRSKNNYTPDTQK